MNTTIKSITIDQIEQLTESDAASQALEKKTIKQHNVYFVDLGGYFGYSCLVFKDGAHIHYANDYELHHRSKQPDELKKMYIKELKSKLYTEKELLQPLKSYDEYTQKRYYIRNYYSMRRPYISIFGNFNTPEKVKEYKQKIKGMIFDSAALAYYDPKYKRFVTKHKELVNNLERLYNDTVNNYEFQKSAFYYEMLNHEYAINWQADYDTLSAFGNIAYAGDNNNELQNYFVQLGFNDTQKRAYIDARHDAMRVEY